VQIVRAGNVIRELAGGISLLGLPVARAGLRKQPKVPDNLKWWRVPDLVDPRHPLAKDPDWDPALREW